MTTLEKCDCVAKDDESEEVVASEEIASTEVLDSPIDVDKAENLMKEMEEALGKLHDLLDTLDTEKAEEDEEEEEEEEEEAEAEAEEEEEEEEDEEEAKSEDAEKTDLAKAVKILKSAGINIYAGKKQTPAPAPKRSTPKPTNWSEFSKSLDEIDRMAEKAGRGY